MQPEIIFENDNMLVLNKPAGLMVHGDGRTSEKTLADWIVEKYPEISDVGEPALEVKHEIRSTKIETNSKLEFLNV